MLKVHIMLNSFYWPTKGLHLGKGICLRRLGSCWAFVPCRISEGLRELDNHNLSTTRNILEMMESWMTRMVYWGPLTTEDRWKGQEMLSFHTSKHMYLFLMWVSQNSILHVQYEFFSLVKEPQSLFQFYLLLLQILKCILLNWYLQGCGFIPSLSLYYYPFLNCIHLQLVIYLFVFKGTLIMLWFRFLPFVYIHT